MLQQLSRCNILQVVDHDDFFEPLHRGSQLLIQLVEEPYLDAREVVHDANKVVCNLEYHFQYQLFGLLFVLNAFKIFGSIASCSIHQDDRRRAVYR